MKSLILPFRLFSAIVSCGLWNQFAKELAVLKSSSDVVLFVGNLIYGLYLATALTALEPFPDLLYVGFGGVCDCE